MASTHPRRSRVRAARLRQRAVVATSTAAGWKPNRCATRCWPSAASLNLQAGGPSFFPPVSKEALEGLVEEGRRLGPSPPEEQRRRSIYMMTKRSLLLPLMTTFDFCDTTQPCGQRERNDRRPAGLGTAEQRLRPRAERGVRRARDRRSGATTDARRSTAPGGWRSAAAPSEAERHARARTCAHVAAASGSDVREAADDAERAGLGLAVPRAVQYQRVHLCRLSSVSRHDAELQRMPDRALALFPCGLTRREFVWEMGGGFAGLALSSLLGGDGFFAPARAGRRPCAADNPLAPQAAALRRQGQELHLPDDERRAEPGRHVRLQARARKVRRPAAARRQEVHQLRRPQDRLPDAGVAPVPARRQERADDLRLLSQASASMPTSWP